MRRAIVCSLFVLIPGLFVTSLEARSTTFPGSDWQVAAPEDVGMDSELLAQALGQISGNVTVVRSGYLVGTRGDPARKYPIYSVSKSYASLIFGRLLQQGLVDCDDQVAGSDVPFGPHSTYRHFMSMTSDYGLTPHEPGDHYAYNNMAIHTYGESMRPFYGGSSPVEILDTALYSFTGRQDPVWYYGLWGGWGGGFETSARDMARVGLLVLRDGNWAGQQVVPAWFVDELYLNQVPGTAEANYSIGEGNTQGPPGDNWWNQYAYTDLLAGNYSFGWWNNASNMYPSMPTRTIWADGLHGHKIIVVPGQDLVVTVTYGGDDIPPTDVLLPILGSITGPPPSGSGGSDSKLSGGPGKPDGGTLSGSLKKWHKLTLSFAGPTLDESSTDSPFRDYRLDVTFRRGARKVVVPGFFAADGNAAQSGAASGNIWQAHFTPDEEGQWAYSARFRKGYGVALSDDPMAGDPCWFHGAKGSFRIGPTDKTGADHRAKGMLRYTGERYLRFAETGEAYIKGGADSPENFLAYSGFDGTMPTHAYAAHAGDWQSGDADWGAGRGRNIVGAVNYLADQGMNSVYFLTMNVQGDGDDVWPWNGKTARFSFDCSKLAQWERVFEQMDRKGIQLHVVTQETENDQLLDGGALGPQRKMYYREMVARFAHHLALTWNLGEENTNTDAQRMQFADHLKSLDPYDHPVVVHTWPSAHDQVYLPLLGHPSLDGPSLQLGNMASTNFDTLKWIDASRNAGRPWVVTLDEIGPANAGVVPDSADPEHDQVRSQALWGNLMAGGAGVEWYFGYAFAHDDLDCEDWRSRQNMWDLTRHALEFFQRHLPFTEMAAANQLSTTAGSLCLADEGKSYAVYLPNGGSTNLQLAAGGYQVRWFNPRTGGSLQRGSLHVLAGGGLRSVGQPPFQAGEDWVVLVERNNPFVAHYGTGVAGGLGQMPLIDSTDPVLGATQFQVRLERARPGALTVLFAGTQMTSTPFRGGQLLNDSSLGGFSYFTNVLGQAAAEMSLPASQALSGVPLYWQFVTHDPGAAWSVSLTDGLATVLHP